MQKLSDVLAAAVFVLFMAGVYVALDQVIGHPARYIEQPRQLGMG